MSKRHIITTIIIAGLLSAALYALDINKKEVEVDEWAFLNEVDEPVYEYSEYNDSLVENRETNVIVPAELNALLPGASWSIDTICTVAGVTYLYASDNDLRTYAICTESTLLAEDPSLTYFETDSITPTIIKVLAGEKTLTVDFRNPSSIEKLRTLSSPVLPGWKRCRWDRTADFCDRVQNNLEIDYPKSSIVNSEYISKWIATVALAQKTGPVRLPLLVSTYLNFEWKDRSGYQGQLNDRNSVANYIADTYFADVEEEFGREDENIPASLFSIISLRARFFNDRYVTYQMFTNDYNGGMHSYYTDQLVSYDCVHHESIGWEYLFKPKTEKSVLRQLEMIAEADEKYQLWDADIWDFIRRVDDDGNPTGEILLPIPSLTPDGVLFSFQPYEISCFAAGCFHFTIPYSRLTTYLTDRAKWCIGLK